MKQNHYVRSPVAGCYLGDASHPNTFLPLTMQTGRAGSAMKACNISKWHKKAKRLTKSMNRWGGGGYEIRHTPPREEVTWQPASFCSYQNYSKHYRVLMKFLKNVENGPRNQDNYILVMFWIPGGSWTLIGQGSKPRPMHINPLSMFTSQSPWWTDK